MLEKYAHLSAADAGRADSLDVAEFVMGIEELADFAVPDELAEALAARIGDDFPAYIAWRDFVARGRAG